MMKRLFVAAILLCITASAGAATHRTDPPAVLDHVAIHVTNGPATAKFYEDVFGFAPMKNPFPGGGGVIWLNIGHGMAMHIFGGRKDRITDERERHFAFGVTDISHVTSYLKAHGMHWQNFDGAVDQMQTRPDGVNQLFFQDLDGYWIEVNDAPAVLKTSG